MTLDDSKRKIVAGVLQPGATEPELREIPNEAKLMRRLIERLKREVAWRSATRPVCRAMIFVGRSPGSAYPVR